MIDILKEEGLSNDQSDIIVSVVTQSMEEVCPLDTPRIAYLHSLSGWFVGD
jgi:hypothetical protein